MESDYNQRLERAVSRELRELPDLPAPDKLVSTVMATIQARSVLPWYRRSWPTWPLSLQTASLVLMLALFGGVCFAGWKFSHAESLVAAMRPVVEWFSAASLIWKTLSVLGGAMILFLKQLNTAFLIAGMAVAFFSYSACVGLGTAFFRYARCQENQL